MKVKRVSYGYVVKDAKYINIRIHYISNIMKDYVLEVKGINQEWGYYRIKYFTRFKDLKDFLEKYESEKELLADYYMARLEGKYTL